MNKKKFITMLSSAAALFIVASTQLYAANTNESSITTHNEQVQVKLTQNEVDQFKSVLKDPKILGILPQKLYDKFAKEIWFGAGAVSMVTLTLVVATLKKALTCANTTQQNTKKTTTTNAKEKHETATSVSRNRTVPTEEIQNELPIIHVERAPLLIPREHQYVAQDHLCWDGTDGIHAPGAMVRGSRIQNAVIPVPAAFTPKTLRDGTRY